MNDVLNDVTGPDRVKVYGDPTETFIRIAQVWSGILGHEVNPTDVPLCLMGMKIVRTTQAPDYSDNSDDIEGYLDIFRQLVGPDMIHARSVTEYVEKKWPTKAERVLVDRDECRHWNRHLQVSDHTEAECPVAGVAADNARQSEFYAQHDRTQDAGPDDGGPIPYTLAEDERVQQLRRAETVRDNLCPECSVAGHDTCGGDPIGCRCCRDAAAQDFSR